MKTKPMVFMKWLFRKFGCLLLISALISACGAETEEMLESGAYEGTIQEVNTPESAVTVRISDEETVDLTVAEETELTKLGKPVPFDSLAPKSGSAFRSGKRRSATGFN